MANPKFTQKNRLLSHLEKLEADIILLDLGAGTSFTTIDFFLYAPNKLVVVTPQVTSIQNAYGFIKSSLYRHLARTYSRNAEAVELIKRASYSVQGESIDSIAKLHDALAPLGGECQEMLMTCLSRLDIKLVVNMVKESKEKKVSDIIRSVAKNYLGLDLEYFGLVHQDDVLHASINRMSGFLIRGTECVANMNTYDIANKIIRRMAQQGTGAEENDGAQPQEPEDHSVHSSS
jgi:flagellar biosynthesis protein FlhG